MRSAKLTLESAFARLPSALATANRHVISNWKSHGDEIESPDRRFIRKNGFHSRTHYSRKHGRCVESIQWRDSTKLAQMLRRSALSEGALAAPVVAVRLRSGRELKVASFRDRVIQSAVADAVSRRLEAEGFFHAGCHSFRRKRGVFSALSRVRNATRAGYLVAHSKDVRKFFESITVRLMERALEPVRRVLARDVIELMVDSFKNVAVMERDRMVAGREALFLGAPLAPLLSNLVGTLFVDHVVDRFGEGVVHCRYADDIVVVTHRDPVLAAAAMDGIHESLQDAPGGGLSLHPKKGTDSPIDLESTPLRYLGLALHGKKIVVPQDVYEGAVEKLRTAPRHKLRAVAAGLMGQLRFLRRQRRERLVAKLVREGLDPESLSPLLRTRPMRDVGHGHGPQHLVFRHDDAVAEHAAAEQLSLPGVR